MQDERKNFIFKTSLSHVFQDPVSSLLTNMACGALLAGLLSPVFGKKALFIWLCSLLLISLIRLSLGKAYADGSSLHDDKKWYAWYFTGTVLSAMVWSSTAFLFFHESSFQYQFFLVTMLSGVCAGAISNQAPFPLLNGLYIFILLAPVLSKFFFSFSSDNTIFMSVFVFFVIAFLAARKRVYKNVLDSFNLRYELKKMAISSEIQLAPLLEQFMLVAIKNSPSTRGFFIGMQNGSARIEAEIDTIRGNQVIVKSFPLTERTDLFIPAIEKVMNVKQYEVCNDLSRVPEYSNHPCVESGKLKSILCMPVLRNENLMGILCLENSINKWGFASDKIAGLKIIASQFAISLENAILYQNVLKSEKEARESEKKLRNLSASVMDQQETERAFLARELHDEFGQIMSTLKVEAVWLKKHFEKSDNAATKRTQDMCDLIDHTIGDVRKIAMRLRPGILDKYGLSDAVKWYINDFQERTGIKCSLFASDVPKMDSRLEVAAYRITQESMTNVSRHSQATKVEIFIGIEDDLLSLVIFDNGCGMDHVDENDMMGLGVIGMQERALQVGGEIRIDSLPDEGTQIIFSAPY